MEIEVKYGVPDQETAEKLWNDNCFEEYGNVSSREEKRMKSVYYDTEDQLLRKADVAYRIRLEGTKTVATMKWGGKNDNGLYTREEINIPVTSGEASLMTPSLQLFKEAEIGRELIALVGTRDLHNTVEMNFIRRSLRLDTGTMICEVALDYGTIYTAAGNYPICEMEIELFSGNQDEITIIGDEIAESYGLNRGPKSKLARGWAVLDAAAAR